MLDVPQARLLLARSLHVALPVATAREWIPLARLISRLEPRVSFSSPLDPRPRCGRRSGLQERVQSQRSWRGVDLVTCVTLTIVGSLLHRLLYRLLHRPIRTLLTKPCLSRFKCAGPGELFWVLKIPQELGEKRTDQEPRAS